MIKLFHIPNYTVDTSKFNNLIHGDIVNEFTENFCRYVGIRYGCPVDCATNAIFLIALYSNVSFKVPTVMTPVVPQALINAKAKFQYTDDVDWVGHSYHLYKGKFINVIDSAQEVVKRQPMNHDDLIIYSFYATKPIGSSDGGMICSNSKEKIDFFRMKSVQGTRQDKSSWNGRQYVDVGWKMYLNSFQAYIANENLKRLDEKKEKLLLVREKYNHALGYNNTSHHLYRINVQDNVEFLKRMKSEGIICGIHYECCHKIDAYKRNTHFDPDRGFYQKLHLPYSEREEKTTLSLPFHEKLTDREILKVISCVKSTGKMLPSN